MARLLQLFDEEGKEILASDGIMYVDGRYNMNNVIEAVKERNKRMKNFPHKIAYSFAIYNKT